MEAMQKKQKEDMEKKELLEQLKGKENVTKSGQKVNVYANIGNLSDVGAVLQLSLIHIFSDNIRHPYLDERKVKV